MYEYKASSIMVKPFPILEVALSYHFMLNINPCVITLLILSHIHTQTHTHYPLINFGIIIVHIPTRLANGIVVMVSPPNYRF